MEKIESAYRSILHDIDVNNQKKEYEVCDTLKLVLDILKRFNEALDNLKSEENAHNEETKEAALKDSKVWLSLTFGCIIDMIQYVQQEARSALNGNPYNGKKIPSPREWREQHWLFTRIKIDMKSLEDKLGLICKLGWGCRITKNDLKGDLIQTSKDCRILGNPMYKISIKYDQLRNNMKSKISRLRKKCYHYLEKGNNKKARIFYNKYEKQVSVFLQNFGNEQLGYYLTCLDKDEIKCLKRKVKRTKKDVLKSAPPEKDVVPIREPMKTPEKDVVSEESLITPEKDVVPIREPMKTPEKDVVSEESLITPEKDVVPFGKEPIKPPEKDVVSKEPLKTPEKDVPISEPMKTPEKDVVSEESLKTPEKDVVPIEKEPACMITPEKDVVPEEPSKTLENEELPNLPDVPVKQLKDVEEFSSDVLLQERLDKIKEFRRNLEMEKTKVPLCDKPIDHLVRDITSGKVGDEKGKYKNKKIVPSYNNRNKHTGISQNTSQNNDRNVILSEKIHANFDLLNLPKLLMIITSLVSIAVQEKKNQSCECWCTKLKNVFPLIKASKPNIKNVIKKIMWNILKRMKSGIQKLEAYFE